MRRSTYILLYLTLFLLVLLTDNQIRLLIELLINPIGERVLGFFTHIGKGHYQMLLFGILLLCGFYLLIGSQRKILQGTGTHTLGPP